MIPSARHESGIPTGLPTRGFRAALRAICAVELGRYPFTPDAYDFDVTSRTLTLYEVYVTNALSERKLLKLRDLDALLGAQDWTLRILIGCQRGIFNDLDLATGGPTQEALKRAVMALDRGSRTP